MPLYDYLAPLYDPAFHPIYLPYRTRALAALPLKPGMRVLDLACGTGQNFPLIAPRLAPGGEITGLDISAGTLWHAARYARAQQHCRIRLVHADATRTSRAPGESSSPRALIPEHSMDACICTYGLSSIPDWQAALDFGIRTLRPGGIFLLHDIHADATHPLPHTRLVELATFTNLRHKLWLPLQQHAPRFSLKWEAPHTRWIFGGTLFTAMAEVSRL